MARSFLLVMDSLGIGGAPDADKFGDIGANTLGHIAEWCYTGKADIEGVRSGPLKIPFLEELGLGLAAGLASGDVPHGLSTSLSITGRWGSASEVSTGKDTISGHWEMAGLPVTFDWGYFTEKTDSFPPELLDALISQGDLPGTLGNCHSSGTEIIAKLGDEHIGTGKPICYTSADSVFQIAAHEQHFGLERLYKLSELTRKLVDPLNVGRVIARPFIGDAPDNYRRTSNRRDYAVPPSQETLLDKVIDNGGAVHAIGKISDIFAGQGVSHKIPASGHRELMEATQKAVQDAGSGDLIFTNFVDFDMLYGHRRDVPGYAYALEEFDVMLREFAEHLQPDDQVILTADHGNDPTWHGSDHTREQVPIIVFGPNIEPGELGAQSSFSAISSEISRHLNVS